VLREGKHGVEYWALVVDPANRGQASAASATASAPTVPAQLGEHLCSVVDAAYCLGQAVSAASAEEGAVIAAGMSTTVASSRKSGMPRRRARTEA
jgi:hypothetical protein